MKRYLFFVFLALLLLAFAIYLGGNIMVFVDIPSILLLLLPLVLLFTQYKFTEIISFFKLPFSDKCDGIVLNKGIYFYNFVGSLMIFSVIIILIIQIVVILTNLSSLSEIGPHLAVFFLYSMYNAIIYLIIILPLRQMLIRKSKS